MDCETFQNSEIDALYGELDAAGSAAIIRDRAEHAATCPSCAARFERLRGTRALVLSVAVEAVPTDFESRIMAAVDAGMASRVAAGPFAAASHAGPAIAGAPYAGAPQPMPMRVEGGGPKPEGGAKIFRFMARPAFAVAATLVLVLSGAAFLMTSSKSSPMASSADRAAEGPAAVAASPPPSPMASAAAAAEPTAAAVALGEANATGGPDDLTKTAALTPPAAPATAMAAPQSIVAGAAKVASKPKASAAEDRAFTAAKALYNAGRYAEALPRFEAIKANNPEAELYAARCIAKTKGCVAAAPRFDTAAQTNAGTEAGNRATLEGAKCYQLAGDLTEARKRYTVAKDEEGVAAEATQALEAMDAKGGTMGGGAHAAPRAAPAPAKAPAAPMPEAPARK